MEILFKRSDDTFVVLHKGLPFHVTPDDPFWEEGKPVYAEVKTEALAMGDALWFEPVPSPSRYIEPEQPTIDQITAAFRATGKTETQIKDFLSMAAEI